MDVNSEIAPRDL
jgi:hypothetical protein